MNSTSSSHVPFAQLSSEARVLFFLLTMTIYGPERPAVQKVVADLEMIWNTEQLALDDFRNPVRMSEVFDKYAAIFRRDVWWLDRIGVSREEAERTGFFRERRRLAQGGSNAAQMHAGGPVSTVTGDASRSA